MGRVGAIVLVGVLTMAGLSGCSEIEQALAPPPTAEKSARTAAVAVAATRLSGKQVRGIDVSHYQGAVDWAAVKAAGINYAYAKAVEGTSEEDPEFQKNWSAMAAAGVLRGAYDFYVVGEAPEAQARNYIRRVTLARGDLPPMVDIETESAGVESDPKLISDLHRFLDILAKHYGAKPIIYTSPGFWNAHFDDSFGDYPLWVAEYGVSQPKPVTGWDRWTFWQYSQSGAVSGITGAVDLDHFNGGAAQLLALRLR